MNYKKVITDSWHFTQQNKSLIVWFGFVPAIFTTTVSIWYIVYQFFAFKTSNLFGGEGQAFFFTVISFLWDFIITHVSWSVPLLIFTAISAVIYFIFPTMAKAAAIQAIARARNGQEYSAGIGMRYGILSFLKLFEYHLLAKTFSFFSILIEASFVVRNLGLDIFLIMIPAFIILIFAALLLTLLFIYTDFYIVIDGGNVFDSIKKSARLVITNWRHTFFITLLMAIIGIRIVIQALIVFLTPALVLLVSGYVASIAIPAAGVAVGVILGFGGLLLTSYLNGVVDVLSYAVWTFTFLELSAEEEVSARERGDQPAK